MLCVCCCVQNGGTEQSVVARSKTGDNAVNLVLVILFVSVWSLACCFYRLIYCFVVSWLFVMLHRLA